MLGRWPNIKPELDQRLVFSWIGSLQTRQSCTRQIYPAIFALFLPTHLNLYRRIHINRGEWFSLISQLINEKNVTLCWQAH